MIGYVDLSGNLDTAIAIRTMVVTPDGRASVQAGAGIVADSDPRDEQAECENKASTILSAVRAAREITASRLEIRERPSQMNQSEVGYRLLREKAALVPLERDFVRLAGPDAVSYLQGQCSQDVVALGPGRSTDALLLEPQGRVDAFIRVTKVGDEELIVDTDAGFGASVIERLERFKLRVKLEISALQWRCVAVRGPQSADFVSGPGSLRVAVDWPGISGFDLLGENPVAPEGIQPSGAQAWEAVRIESGIPVMGAEIDDRTIPEEAGLVERSVSFTKGCFTGQELVARIDSRGSNVARRIRGLVAPLGASPEALAPGTELFEGGAGLFEGGAGRKSVGRVTSTAWSEGLGATIGLAYVHRSVDIPSEVIAGDLSVQVRQLPLVA